MSNSSNRTRRVFLALSFALSGTLLVTGWAAAQIARKEVLETDGDLKVTVAGQVVSIDPTTGRLRQPTPQQRQSLLETLRKIGDPPAEPVVVTHPNGMLSVEVPESYEEATIARLNPDGSLSFDCVYPDGIAKALAQTPVPAPMVTAAPEVKTIAKKAAKTSTTKRRAALTARATAKNTSTPIR